MIFRSIVIPSLLLWTVSASAQDTLTVHDAVARALQNSPLLEQAQANVRAAEARVGQSRSAELPVADASATYVRMDPVSEFVIGGKPMELAPHNNYDIRAGVRHEFYDFGRKHEQTLLIESRVQTAAHSVEAARSAIAYQTIRAFYSLLYLQRSAEVKDAEIGSLKEHLSLASKKVEVGVATNFDVLTTQVRVAAADNQRVDIQNAISRQQTTLRELMGLPWQTPIAIKGDFAVDSSQLNQDSLVAQAMAQRSEAKLVRDAELSAKLQQKIASLTDYPALRGNLMYGVKNGYEPNLNAWRGNWAATAQVVVPIYAGNRRKFSQQEADAALRAEQYRRDALEQQIRGEIGRALADVKSSAEKLAITDVRIEQASQALEIARSRYQSGTMTNMDILDAETALAEARLAREQVLLSCRLSRVALQQAVGAVVWP
jgi:outer membrane protein TolC